MPVSLATGMNWHRTGRSGTTPLLPLTCLSLLTPTFPQSIVGTESFPAPVAGHSRGRGTAHVIRSSVVRLPRPQQFIDKLSRQSLRHHYHCLLSASNGWLSRFKVQGSTYTCGHAHVCAHVLSGGDFHSNLSSLNYYREGHT